MDIERSRIAQGLRRLREEHDYTQEYVAEVLGKNDSTAYSRLEQGKTELKFDDAFKLASLYKVSMEQIYDPSLRNMDKEAFSESRYAYEISNKVSMNVTLDGSADTLRKQIELLESVNSALSKKL